MQLPHQLLTYTMEIPSIHKKEEVLQELLEQKLLPLYYHDRADTSIAILQALYQGGIRIIEYTNRGPNALQNFRALRKIADREMPGLQLGIGTIKNREQASQFVHAGADFIVCPSMNPEVGEAAYTAGVLWIPGCMTPTEIAAAENTGAILVKIFPGNLLGPEYLRSIKDIFPGMQYVVTGGVAAEATNLREWFSAGVSAVGMGSKLITKDLVRQEQYESIAHAAAQALQLVQQASEKA